MTKDEYTRRYLEELTGILLVSFFAVDDNTKRSPLDYQKQGKAMIDQQKRAKSLLERIWEDLKTPEKKP